MNRILPVALVAAAVAASSACVVVDSQAHIAKEEKRFTVTGTPHLKLNTFDGSIEIRTGDDKVVNVEIEKRGPTEEAIGKLKIDTTQDGDRIEVSVKKPDDHDGFVIFGIGPASPSARLIVTMPKNGDVLATSGDGSIRVDRVHGTLELRTGDGSIHTTDAGGQLTLHTGDGSIHVAGMDGDLDLETGDGSVDVAGRPGVLKAHTGDGSVTVRADANTRMTDNWSITTGDGSVTVYLPNDFSAALDASSGDGTVRSELTVAGSNQDADSREHRSLRGQLGQGGKTFHIRSGDGSIRLKAN